MYTAWTKNIRKNQLWCPQTYTLPAINFRDSQLTNSEIKKKKKIKKAFELVSKAGKKGKH